jgi:hypothetical protein
VHKTRLLLLTALVGMSLSLFCGQHAYSHEPKLATTAQEIEVSSIRRHYRGNRVYRRVACCRRPIIPYACAAVVFPRSPLCYLAPYRYSYGYRYAYRYY